MTANKILKKLIESEEKSRKLPPLSAKEAEVFDTKNMMGSIYYSNLLEGNTLSKKEAVKAMIRKKDAKKSK